ncbi:TRAP transporter substrate-binding protein [Paenalcaligenes hominis]|uniref:TRAP-type C4-dicarboxylate transport system substrate-binding protein n=2 Tax=Paenalcaligenes hominis TaxID=643674 RepID=A0ABX0WRY6_9BURK|nr:TRAP-type C4-dicarboxylate transport system substrate-binding protein [Paenalcaligenes hominis]GGE65302.1 transporter [Paenalcaligenes hominis]
MKRLFAASLLMGFTALNAQAQEVVTDLPQTKLNVVGGLSNLTAYQNGELPFWSKTIPELSDGKITVDIKGYNEMGLKGPEVLRLVSQGVIPIGSATLAYFATDNPINEAIDLAGLAPDIETARAVTEAFLPVYEKHYDANNAKLLGISTYPAQVLFCKGSFTGLNDLKGKKVRTSSRTQAEFVQAFGGSSVTIPFGEVVPALQNGVVDCAITGSLSGYSAKWYEVSDHLYALPINWNQQLIVANKAFWNKLDPKVQTFLEENVKTLVDNIWDAAAAETQQGYDCNTGADACTLEPKGKMKLVEPTDEDRRVLQEVMDKTVIPAWAARCSTDCVESFNVLVAPVLFDAAN